MTPTPTHDTRRQQTPAGGGERLRAAGAAVVLLALLVGVPVLLIAFIGNPLPQHVPTGHQLGGALSRPLPDNAVIRVIAVVAWLAWATLLVNVSRETVAQLRGLPSPHRLPVVGFNQALAHQLVAAALVLIPTAANAHAAPVSALTRAAGDPYPAAFDRPAATLQLAPDTAGRDGGMARHEEASFHAVTGARSGDNVLRSARAPLPKPSAHKVYVVQPPDGRHYDSLWDIAARHLGDGRRYHEIYELNKGRPQPDGGELTRASLIQPGWVLLLPDDATGQGVTTVADDPAPHRHDQRPDAAAPAPPPISEKPSEAPATSMPTPRPRPPEPSRSEAEHQSSLRGSSESARESEHGIPVAPIGIGLGVGSLAALAALQRSRRAAMRRRPRGERPAPTPPELKPVEAGLRAEARRVQPVADTVRLATALAAQRGLDTTVESVVRRDDGAVELYLAKPTPAPPPFTTTDHGWLLDADATGFAFAVDEDTDPLPALLQIGRCADGGCYVDLEASGYVALDGEPDPVDDLLATVAARLVGAPWAGLTHVMIPARLATRVGPLEHVEAVANLTDRAEELMRYASTVSAQLRDANQDVAAARRAGFADSVALLTLVGWRSDEIPGELVHAALDPSIPMLAITAGGDPRAQQQWRLAEDTLTGVPSVGPVTVSPRPPAADQVAELIEHTRTAAAVSVNDPAYMSLRADAPAELSTTPPAMSVDVLGPVELSGIDEPTPRRTPIFRTLVYLALHRRGVTAEQLSTALWPDELAMGRTVRNRVAEARALVAGGITNGPGWQLADSVGCDWQRFQALAAGSPDEQLAALELVRGQPFEGFADEWVDVEMLRTDMVAAIIDLSAEVAERALANDDPAVAFRAARTGLRASPYEERLYRLAMQAADAEGSTGKLRALMNELQHVLDVQVEPDDRMQRETVALYEELTSAERRRQRVH